MYNANKPIIESNRSPFGQLDQLKASPSLPCRSSRPIRLRKPGDLRLWFLRFRHTTSDWKLCCSSESQQRVCLTFHVRCRSNAYHPWKAHQFVGSNKEVSSSFDIPEQELRRVLAHGEWTGFDSVSVKGSGVVDTGLGQLGESGISSDFRDCCKTCLIDFRFSHLFKHPRMEVGHDDVSLVPGLGLLLQNMVPEIGQDYGLTLELTILVCPVCRCTLGDPTREEGRIRQLGYDDSGTNHFHRLRLDEAVQLRKHGRYALHDSGQDSVLLQTHKVPNLL